MVSMSCFARVSFGPLDRSALRDLRWRRKSDGKNGDLDILGNRAEAVESEEREGRCRLRPHHFAPCTIRGRMRLSSLACPSSQVPAIWRLGGNEGSSHALLLDMVSFRRTLYACSPFVPRTSSPVASNKASFDGEASVWNNRCLPPYVLIASTACWSCDRTL